MAGALFNPKSKTSKPAVRRVCWFLREAFRRIGLCFFGKRAGFPVIRNHSADGGRNRDRAVERVGDKQIARIGERAENRLMIVRIRNQPSPHADDLDILERGEELQHSLGDQARTFEGVRLVEIVRARGRLRDDDVAGNGLPKARANHHGVVGGGLVEERAVGDHALDARSDLHADHGLAALKQNRNIMPGKTGEFPRPGAVGEDE
ncbi:hypothetical protein SDC9_148112 [bioreactor metagenome]|uniref:Uncharacterized protein n=1 Tax=bioreactor metagenome TaxID=1076179 RepID=A0A645EJL8_9ZZZZ